MPLPENLLRRRNASGKTLAFLMIVIGGGGGGLNSPSRKRLPGSPTSLVSSPCLARLLSADRIQADQSILLPIPTHQGEVKLDAQPSVRLRLELLRANLLGPY